MELLKIGNFGSSEILCEIIEKINPADRYANLFRDVVKRTFFRLSHYHFRR